MERFQFEAAAATVNALTGSRVEYVNRPSRVQFYAVQVTNTDRWGIEVGNKVIVGAQEGFADIQATARPIIPDDLVAECVAMPGEQIRFPVSAVTTAVRGVVVVTPIA
jgi:hypothetical protein